MRLLVTGGRRFRRRDLVWSALDRLHAAQRVSLLIEGEAQGTDRLARLWAEHRGIPLLPCPIRAGESGYDRNGRMLLEGRPDLVTHFPGGSGTADMVRRAREAGLPVVPALEEPSPQLGLPI